MKYPSKLNKLPIVSAVCEIRFSTEFPIDFVSGKIFDVVTIKKKCKTEELPISKIPSSVRSSDINMRYFPDHKIDFENVIFRYGSSVLLVGSIMPYIGWQQLKKEIDTILDSLFKTDIINSVERVGYRVINFFEFDILEKSKFEIVSPLGCEKTNYSYTEVNRGVVPAQSTRIVLSDGARYPIDGRSVNGSILDIDAYQESEMSKEKVSSVLSELHDLEKAVFFDSLKDSFINELDPQY